MMGSQTKAIEKEETNSVIVEGAQEEELSEKCSKRDKPEEVTSPTEQKEKKKQKILDKYEEVYLKDLPQVEVYERSYMHRDVISHLLVTKSQFLVTCAIDGSCKFWKKTTTGIEFLKHFNCHNGPIKDITVNQSGNELASISGKDKTINIFDVVNFDMINFITVDFEMNSIEWTQPVMSVDLNLAVSDSSNQNIYLFDARQADGKPKRFLENLHSSPVIRMRFNPIFNCIISVDLNGEFRYWHNSIRNFKHVKQPIIQFNSYSKTDLNLFARKSVNDDADGSTQSSSSIQINDIRLSPNGSFFVTSSSDRVFRIFKFRTGALVCAVNESLSAIEQRHKSKPLMASIDFLRKMTIEKDIQSSNAISYQTAIFDQSGLFVIYPNIEGVKVYNWKTNKVVKIYGGAESLRPLSLALFQGAVNEKTYRVSLSNSCKIIDPTLFCNSYKKNRFYLFTNRNFEDLQQSQQLGDLTTVGEDTFEDRDIYNEPKTKEELLTSVEFIQRSNKQHSYDRATIHTTMGDIHLKLFRDIAPKTVENFCSLAKSDYYNSQIFHRVIKDFMIQTGDSTGTGKGGESIWGGFFEDEFSELVDFTAPFMLGMANCETPNTNGSQFFITVAPCDHLTRKHTIFGRVLSGMDVCLSISKTKTRYDNDKPLQEIKIINIRVYNNDDS